MCELAIEVKFEMFDVYAVITASFLSPTLVMGW